MEFALGSIGIVVILGMIGYCIDVNLTRIADALEKIEHALRYPAKKP